jgi:hypothetical protein
MNAENVEQQTGGEVPSWNTAVLIGSVLLLLSTTVPYLTIVNAFLFAGIIFSGAFAVYYYIMHNQVRLSYGQAFAMGAFSGLAGGALSVVAGYILITAFGYRPGLESLRLLADWGSRVSPEDAGTFRKLLDMVSEPVELSVTDLIVSVLFTGMFYAPFAGLGGRLTVFILKRQARRSTPQKSS